MAFGNVRVFQQDSSLEMLRISIYQYDTYDQNHSTACYDAVRVPAVQSCATGRCWKAGDLLVGVSKNLGHQESPGLWMCC